MYEATPGWSNLIGPEAEWIVRSTVDRYRSEEAAFWWVVENIVQSIPGTYDELPWEYTEKASRRLMR